MFNLHSKKIVKTTLGYQHPWILAIQWFIRNLSENKIRNCEFANNFKNSLLSWFQYISKFLQINPELTIYHYVSNSQNPNIISIISNINANNDLFYPDGCAIAAGNTLSTFVYKFSFKMLLIWKHLYLQIQNCFLCKNVYQDSIDAVSALHRRQWWVASSRST